MRQLTLFLDDNRLIRAKGRFAVTSSLVLLPQNSHFTELLILDCNHRMHHIGVGGTIVALRNRFWVPTATACRLLRKCTRCREVTGRHYTLPPSPELPQFCQDTFIRPFSTIGVDFTGHLTVKDRSGNHIRYIFVCLPASLPELSASKS